MPCIIHSKAYRANHDNRDLHPSSPAMICNATNPFNGQPWTCFNCAQALTTELLIHWRPSDLRIRLFEGRRRHECARAVRQDHVIAARLRIVLLQKVHVDLDVAEARIVEKQKASGDWHARGWVVNDNLADLQRAYFGMRGVPRHHLFIHAAPLHALKNNFASFRTHTILINTESTSASLTYST